MRKLLLLTSVATAIAISTQAQINKGTILLGGNISGSTNKETNSNATYENKFRGVTIAPSIGFATGNNKIWGFNANYGSTRSKHLDLINFEYNRYGGGIFYRRYATLGKGFYLFGKGNAGYTYSKTREKSGFQNEHTTKTTRTDIVSISVHPGIAYAVHKNFHLELAINNIASLN